MKMARFGVSSWRGVGDTTLGGEVVVLLSFTPARSSGWFAATNMSFRVWLMIGS